MRKIIAKIDLKNIQDNAAAFVRVTEKPVCAVVKANAYGHGAEEVVNALSGVVQSFAVSLLDEAKAIRVAACGKDILILTPPLDGAELTEAALNGFVITVGDMPTARMAVSVANTLRLPVRVHLKVNTGMNRYGMNAQTLGKACKLLAQNPLVVVEGVYSHLYAQTLATAREQRSAFLKLLAVCRRYYPKVQAHLSATYGVTLGKDFYFDGVRVGIGLYGYLPDGARDMQADILRALPLKKAMSVYASVMNSRKYCFGGAGYGTPKKQAFQDGRLSVLRIGYADGVLRSANNGLDGYEKNANNLCMDACMREGKLLRGREIPVMTDAAKTAEATGTISYEVLCAATRRAETVYVYGEASICGKE